MRYAIKIDNIEIDGIDPLETLKWDKINGNCNIQVPGFFKDEVRDGIITYISDRSNKRLWSKKFHPQSLLEISNGSIHPNNKGQKAVERLLDQLLEEM